MGNCMEADIHRLQREMVQIYREEEQEEGGFAEDSGIEKGGLRVKIVLTKGELECLMLKLKDGGKRLEDILEEIKKGRSKKWTPSLESIMEWP
ncbi:hypothetical protein GIB67_006408 [Kingdonia uniflora]|uniref:Uncharacterized protein n=1 Tax=Kingdonia uniflora TaxID=39325 RepID=A0A7J7P1B9_9MAGN|nr:hypothetical protein GIB67_006408 [Kingdonia uniflora]